MTEVQLALLIGSLAILLLIIMIGLMIKQNTKNNEALIEVQLKIKEDMCKMENDMNIQVMQQVKMLDDRAFKQIEAQNKIDLLNERLVVINMVENMKVNMLHLNTLISNKKSDESITQYELKKYIADDLEVLYNNAFDYINVKLKIDILFGKFATPELNTFYSKITSHLKKFIILRLYLNNIQKADLKHRYMDDQELIMLVNQANKLGDELNGILKKYIDHLYSITKFIEKNN